MRSDEFEPKPAGWPPSRHRPRVLVETDDAVRGSVYDRVLSEEGFDVAVCPGPQHQPGGCPLLNRGNCTLAQDADAVILAFTWLDGTARRLLYNHELGHTDLPIVVHARGRQTGHESVNADTTWTDLVRTLRTKTRRAPA